MTSPSGAPVRRQPNPAAAPGSEWARLHPLSPVLQGWRVLGIVAAIVAQERLRRGEFSGLQILITVAVVIPVVGATGYLSWRRRRWRVEGGDLRIDYGVVIRKSRRVPLARLQAIDVVRPLLARALGLAELRLEVGGHGGEKATLAYLTEPHAQQVRAYLLDLAHRPVSGAVAATAAVESPVESPPATGWGPNAEALLVAVPPGRFVMSVLLSGAGGMTYLFVAAIVVTVVLAPAAAGAIVVALLPLGAALYRKFTVEFGFTVSLSPQGVRLRHGLLDTRMQTVPRGRVQAIRLVEPMLWRRLGWIRVEVDVAGYRSRGATGAEERLASGVLLPVATHAEAEGVIHAVLPGLDLSALPLRPPPPRARWRAPLLFRFLGAAVGGGWSVTSYGRIRRVRDVVPLDKLQSVRYVQGPYQRKLRVATVHLDTAGRNVHAAIAHWDVATARQLTDDLAALARTARSQFG